MSHKLIKIDHAYFKKNYEKYRIKVFNYFLYRVGRDRAQAEDLTQETFARAFSALSRFEDRNIDYLSYLLTIAHNLLINYYRSKKPILIEDMDQLKIPIDSTAKVETEVLLVWEAVQKLSPLEQVIFSLRYRQDKSIEAIAKIVKKSSNAVKLHLSRSRRKLRTYFT